MSQNDPEISFEMKHAGTRKLFEYWSDLRGGRTAPYKSEVTVQGIGRTLASSTFVLEKLADGTRRFRLAGSGLYDVFGLELRGMSAHTMVELDGRERLDSLLDHCLSGPSVCVIDCQAQAPEGAELSIEILLAPLRSDFDQLSRILGAVNVLDQEDTRVEAAPRKCRILSAKTFDVTRPSRFDVDAPMPGFADTGTTFDFEGPDLSAIEGGAKTGRPRRGHLKVVKE